MTTQHDPRQNEGNSPPLRVLDVLKFAGGAATIIVSEGLVFNLPVLVLFERWLFVCVGAFAWALLIGNRRL